MTIKQVAIGVLFLVMSSSLLADSDLNTSELLTTGLGVQEKTLKLASTEWCPFICNSESRPGVIVEYLRELLARENITLEVDLLPWSRAILQARNGKYHGLLTSTAQEAPDFMFPHLPTGKYQMCFFSVNPREFVYVNRASLRHIRLGVVQNYGYGEPIDSVIKSPRPAELIFEVASATPLKQLIKMANVGRIDMLIEDKLVMANYLLSTSNVNMHTLDCMPSQPFYTAIAPHVENSDFWVNKIATVLQGERAELIYQELLSKYQLGRVDLPRLFLR